MSEGDMDRLAHEVARAASWWRAWRKVFGRCFLMNDVPRYERADKKERMAAERFTRAVDAYEEALRKAVLK